MKERKVSFICFSFREPWVSYPLAPVPETHPDIFYSPEEIVNKNIGDSGQKCRDKNAWESVQAARPTIRGLRIALRNGTSNAEAHASIYKCLQTRIQSDEYESPGNSIHLQASTVALFLISKMEFAKFLIVKNKALATLFYRTDPPADPSGLLQDGHAANLVIFHIICKSNP